MLHAEVVNAVHNLAKKRRARFRASYVATITGLPIDVVQKNMVALTQIGDLRMDFEVMCPGTGETIKSFRLREQIPKMFSHDECCEGKEFEITPQLIWVTFTPTDELRAQLADQSAGRSEEPRGDDPPGNCLGPRRPRATRAPRTGSMRSSSRQQVPSPVWFTSITGTSEQSRYI